ncbi:MULTISPECIES: sigma 54-interacting transcriptional regulator [Sporomusa]|uniref:sigma 54-interacting transcriptional regulator n=1 Tax=Sporomusa TaxID=2375 RepID=UPI003158D6DF
MNRIAFIAPYTNLATLAREICAETYPDVKVFEGLLDEGLDCAQQVAVEGCQVIISRGGTASLIQENLNLPVVEVKVTGYDILHTISDLIGKNKTIGVIGYHNVVRDCRAISQMLQIKSLELLTLNSTENPDWQAAQARLHKKLLQTPVDILVGDTLVISKLNLNVPEVRLIVSGAESIYEAIEEARRIAQVQTEEKKSAEQLRTILHFIHDGVVAIDDSGNITVMNPAAETIFNSNAAQAIGKPITRFIANSKLPDILISGKAELDQLQSTPSGMIVTSKIPIKVNGKVEGAVATFQETGRIQKTEQKIRLTLHAKGLFAKYSFSDIMAWDHEMKRTIDKAMRYALTDGTVLIQAESGCGKELFAQSIHQESSRSSGPFVAVNCSALPPQLLESELFGYVAGAFTGARKEGKPGLVELAHGGTLFLDEIGDMELGLQARLLRVLGERQVMRLGSDNWMPVDIRVIAATHVPLKQKAFEGLFRMDLFYRLNVLTIAIPPLRQRVADIYPLANYFLSLFAEKYGRSAIELPPEAHDALIRYPWPGNVRELRNTMERLVLTYEETGNTMDILLDSLKELDTDSVRLPAAKTLAAPAAIAGHSLAAVSMKAMKHQLAVDTLKACGGNKSKAAKQLGVTRYTLDRLLK